MLRKPLGGRGREWATESLRLLETMLDLDDSKNFTTPPDPLKYPDYYSMVAIPIDLSKVMLKFHGGSYLTLEEFAKDMRQMFENYKKFFHDPNSEIYSQVHRLSWWFEAEYERIKQKWGKDGHARSFPRSCPILPKGPGACLKRCSVPRPANAGRKRTTLDERIRMLRECNRVTEDLTRTTIASPINSHTAKREDPNTNIILSIKHGTCTIVPGKDKMETNSVAGNGIASSPKELAISPAATSTPQNLMSPGCPVSLGSGHCRKRGRGGPNDPGPPQRIPRFLAHSMNQPFIRPSAHIGMMLRLETNNIWFGSSRYKPREPVTLTEEGFQIPIRHNEQDVIFSIKSEAIIRCAANFSRARKHTLFLFVLPSCTTELQRLFGNEFPSSNNMIVLFLRPLAPPEISQLIHIFWNMSKTNMFGQLFSEVDQRSALALLANIKPAILKRLPDTLRNGPPHRGPGRGCNMPWPFHMGPHGGQCDSNDNGEPDPRTSPHGPHGHKGMAGVIPQLPIFVSAPLQSPGLHQQMPPPQSTQSPYSTFSDMYTNQHMPGYTSIESFGSPKDSESSGNGSVSTEASNLPVKKDDTDMLFDDFGGVEEENKPSDEQKMDDTSLEIIDDGSDLEIVIPSDSEEDEKSGEKESKPSQKSEDDIVMTSEKISIRCPITQQVMKHPVKNKHCGHCYDREGVEGLIKHRGDKARCPVPGCSSQIPLRSKDMLYEYLLWKHIQGKLNPSDPKFSTSKP